MKRAAPLLFVLSACARPAAAPPPPTDDLAGGVLAALRAKDATALARQYISKDNLAAWCSPDAPDVYAKFVDWIHTSGRAAIRDELAQCLDVADWDRAMVVGIRGAVSGDALVGCRRLSTAGTITLEYWVRGRTVLITSDAAVRGPRGRLLLTSPITCR